MELLRSEYAADEDYQEILVEFVAEIPDRVASLQEALQENDVQELGRKAHQLKGAGGGYGFPQITEAASRLESACKAHEPEEILQQTEALVELLKHVTV